MLLYSIISAIIIIIDQLTKIFISPTFTHTTRYTAIPELFDIVYRQNTGAAFSILSKHVYLLSIISVLFCIGLIVYVVKAKPKHPLQMVSLAMIFAGAFGNGIDRVFRGYVVDFIETTFINFPVFNIADVSITIGAALLVIYVIMYDKN